MPKKEVDYSNTIIYKIFCKDESITDVYVGHTTNFIQRKYLHKHSCNNLNYNLKIYNVIRSNGGWENWDMVEIAKYNCKDATEARIKEQHHYNEIKASLNSCPPCIDKTQYFCDTCNLQCMTPKQYENHMNCDKHMKNLSSINFNEPVTEGNKIDDKSTNYFYCDICDYETSHKGHYNEHLNSLKHSKRNQNGNIGNKIDDKIDNNLEIVNICCKICNKKFKTRSGLWKHKKVCIKNEENNDSYDEKNYKLVEYLMKENKEIKEMILEIVKNGITNTNTNSHNNTTTTNSHNKAFNLNFFLNETCKNAMNITDFVDSIKLQLSDLMEVGELGYVEGISKIIVKNLNNLDETIRPVHCTDKKRETMYVKDEGEWNKEDEKKTKLTKAVKKIADKNIRLLPQFREKYPEYKNSSSKTSDKYDKIVIEAMTTDEDKNEKIIKNISKVTTIT